MIGKKVRLNRLFKHSKRTFIVPMDHGVNVGPIAGLQDMEYVVKRIARGGFLLQLLCRLSPTEKSWYRP